MDLGSAVNVARRNIQELENARVIQGDLHHPPFETNRFDFVYSIGVLHHLPDPEATFHNMLRFLNPGGEIQIYVYWKPEGQPIKKVMLAALSALRKITTRLPHCVVRWLAFPMAVLAFALLSGHIASPKEFRACTN